MRFTRTKKIKVFARTLSFSAVLLVAGTSGAVTYEITAPCSASAAREGRYNLPSNPTSVGAATLEILSREALPYIGSERGLNSLLETPVGDNALEVLSETEMQAYGWCYEVDGKLPDGLAHQVYLKNAQHLRWFYGFAHYRAGDWVSFCNPTTSKTAARYCQ